MRPPWASPGSRRPFWSWVRRRGTADEPLADLRLARGPAERLLRANPDLQVHHMHDPNQDRLMLQRVMYFRLKRRRLRLTYRRFLEERLRSGGMVLLIDCGLRWPGVRVAERHVFQPGAAGGLTPREYLEGGPRVRDLLRRHGVQAERWRQPYPDGEYPEAEWGFEPSLAEDLVDLADRRGFRILRLAFQDPDHLSPVVADLYRDWYVRLGMPADRLLVESFALLEPWWTIRTGTVPYWTKFSVEPSAAALERYLASADPYAEIRAVLFCHGVESAGIAGPSRWRRILDRATVRGGFLGLDPARFPRDFGVFVRYHRDLKRVPSRFSMPPPLSLEEFMGVLDRHPLR